MSAAHASSPAKLAINAECLVRGQNCGLSTSPRSAPGLGIEASAPRNAIHKPHTSCLRFRHELKTLDVRIFTEADWSTFFANLPGWIRLSAGPPAPSFCHFG